MNPILSPETGVAFVDKNLQRLTGAVDNPIVESLGIYLMRSGFSLAQLESKDGIQALEQSTASVEEVLDGDIRSMPRNLRYMQDRTAPLDVQLERLVSNAEFVRVRMGDNFFRNRLDRSERMTHYTTPILDGRLWLGVKGGSGAGSFSIDIAVGQPARKDFRHMRGEMWRVGVDTISGTDGGSARVVKLGSAMSSNKIGAEDKRKLAQEFIKTYGICLPRAMASLALLSAHALAEPNLRLVTQGTFSSPRYTGHSGMKVKFDYEALFASLGFSGRKDQNHVLTLPNSHFDFYSNLIDIDKNGEGLHQGELAGLEQIIYSFNEAKDAITDRVNPLQLIRAGNEELIAIWLATKDMRIK